MGGYNSGRQGRRAVIEAQQRVDVRELRRRGLLTAGQAGAWVEAALAEYSWDGNPYQVALPLTRIPCRFGGWRYYFKCQRCARRVEILVLAGGRTWGCRRCLRLRYISQGLAIGDRCERRADKLRDRVAIDDGANLHKRKWLRWRTFNRTCERADELQQVADGAFVARVACRFG